MPTRPPMCLLCVFMTLGSQVQEHCRQVGGLWHGRLDSGCPSVGRLDGVILHEKTRRKDCFGGIAIIDRGVRTSQTHSKASCKCLKQPIVPSMIVLNVPR